jgi:hypothetical protein
MTDSPFGTGLAKTIYYEVKITKLGRAESGEASSLAIGYCAVPYPTFRMPGWQRASLAIHSDDGRRYVADTDGGVDFTAPIVEGETVGIGITFSLPDATSDFAPSPTEGMSLKGEVFFTRNGTRDGGWDIHEELDADNEFGILGLDGGFDLFAAIGIFGEVAFEIKFKCAEWSWRPRS